MTTVLDGIVASINAAGAHDTNATAAPVAILWPDPDDAWAPLVPHIASRRRVVTIGSYDPAADTGPAIWVRAQLGAANTEPLVVRMPGVRRSELQGVEHWPGHLQPIAELQFRSQWWQASSSEAWTPLSFLRSKHGLALPVSGDAATASALPGSLVELVGRDVDSLRQRGTLDADYLTGLVVKDELRQLLRWMNDPTAARSELTPAQWHAFRARCAVTFAFNPDSETPISAAQELGGRAGAWNDLWDRFAETAAGYPHIPALLDQARPDDGGLFTTHPSSWPSVNQEQEAAVRSTLTQLHGAGPAVAVTRLGELEDSHGERRAWLWASPLADALEHLVGIARAVHDHGPTSTVADVAQWYASTGWTVDDHALRAIAAAPSQADRMAVLAALSAVYAPWVDRTARQLQALATATSYPGETGLLTAPGTCVVFIDGLRLDLGRRLAALLSDDGRHVELAHRIAAFPTVTPTGKPAVAPVSGLGTGPEFAAGDPQKRAFVGNVFDKGLAAAGVEKLGGHEIGDPSGMGWTEAANIDSTGHAHDHALADRVDAELRGVAERVAQLLEAGWARVVVVTDHGFLLGPVPLEKVELAQHLTENDSCRKPRVARLKSGAPDVAHPTVPWTWDDTVRMVSPPGSASFVAGRLYEHGGISLQECVTPVVTVTGGSATATVSITALKWTGMRCRIDTTAGAGVVAELRRAAGDPSSSVTTTKQVDESGEVKLLVTDDHLEGTAVHVVLLDAAGTVLAQRATTVGGDSV